MNTDIRLSVGFWEHPKTIKLERRLGLAGIRSLQILWIWAAQNRSNGVLDGMTVEDIEIAAKWNGEPTALVRSLYEVRFLDLDDETYSLHGWAEHNSYQAESELRAGKSRLARLARDFKEAHKLLQDNGRIALTEEEYSYLRSNNGRTTAVQKILNDRSSPFQCLSFTKPKPKPKEKQFAQSPSGVRADGGTLVCDKATAKQFSESGKPPREDLMPLFLPVKSEGMAEVAFIKAENWQEWTAIYGEGFCREQLRKAYKWVLDNPDKAKTTRGIHKFFGSWLEREQNSRGSGSPRASPQSRLGPSVQGNSVNGVPRNYGESDFGALGGAV